jgi:hypothetical protein
MTPTRSLLTVSAVLLVAPVAGAWAAGPAVAPALPTPLRIAETPRTDFATALALDGEAYAELRRTPQAIVTGFPLDADTRVDLALERFEIFAPDARIVRASGNVEVPMPRPDVVLLRGTVVDQPDSSVFLALSPHGTNGVITCAEGHFIISGGRFNTADRPVIYDVKAVPEGAIDVSGFECGLDQLPEFELAGGAGGGAAAAVPDECGLGVLVAVETDWQFTNDLFEGDPVASAAYAGELIAAVSEIYLRDVGVSILISNLRIWSDANDFWTDDNSIFEQLYEFRDYYNQNEQGMARHTAHFLSGRALPGAGGVAYLPGLCQGEWAYGLSAHLIGFFPYPLEDNHPQNWDIVVVAHELGHNFGAPHTHAMNPPIDECAYGGCENADEGTLMSYCHTCEGGIANIMLQFHPRIIEEEILPYLESPLDCVLSEAAAVITSQPVGGVVCAGDPFAMSVGAEGQPPMTYQWRKNGLDIIGANGITYAISETTFGHAGTYDVVVSNVCGDVVSEPAVLTVDDCGSTPCLWDCQSNPDGIVNVPDFLAMLAQWGQVGTSCDFDGNGVSVTDFLDLLAFFGPCPP